MSSGDATLAVIGLGYVGLPVAASFAAKGFRVFGLDVSVPRVRSIAAGRLPFETNEPGLMQLLRVALDSGKLTVYTDVSDLPAIDVFVLAVDTPIDANRRPDTSSLVSACDTIAAHTRNSVLVVVESTVAPGTLRRVVAPRLAHVADVLLVHCPERVRPGRLLHNLRTMSRTVGAQSAEAAAVTIELYKRIVEADLVAETWETAEVIKTAENATRDVQIALGNQLALICDYEGVDVRKVQKNINALWSTEELILEPGAGVGGYCLPKDPWMLVSGLPSGVPSELIAGARRVNDFMPKHVVELVRSGLSRIGRSLAVARVAVLGLTYNADAEDTRNAPGPLIAGLLRQAGASVTQHDPFVTSDGPPTSIDADAIVLVIPHSAYKALEYGALRRISPQLIVDCRRALDGKTLEALGYCYIGLGVGGLFDPPQLNPNP